MAVLLQDMRTRFGGQYITYLIAIAWPLSHIGFIIIGYLAVNKIAPIGDDPATFLTTGLLPYILCLYPAKNMSTVMYQNWTAKSIPIVRPVHMIASRLILEILTSFIVIVIIYVAMSLAGIDIVPLNMDEAVLAILSTLYLSTGLGVLNVLFGAVAGPYFVVVFVILMVALYITSGVYLAPGSIPASTREYLVYNPIFNLVEWLRSAYYATYDSSLVDKPLILGTATVALFLGLLGERLLRNKFLVN